MADIQAPAPSSVFPVSQLDRGKSQFWRWFWLGTLVVSLGSLWYCYYVPSNNIVWAQDYTSAQQLAAQSGKPILLFFTGKWCVPCRIMKRNVWADEQVATSVNARFIAVTIDVDDPDAAAVLSRYRVGTTPSTIVTDPQGKVLQQKEGGMVKTEFLELLGKVESLRRSAQSMTSTRSAVES